MKIRSKSLIFVAVGLLGIVPLVAYGRSYSKWPYAKDSVRGTWAWSYSGQLASRYKFASIGTATFDGKGGCTITLRENSGVNGGYDHNSSECSYDIAKTGFGRMDYSLDGEAGSAELIVGHNRISFVAPEEGTVAVGEMLRLASSTPKAASGNYSFAVEGSVFGEPMTGVGKMRFKADGKCMQRIIYNYGTAAQKTKSESCSFSFAEDGIGEVDMTYDNGTGGDLYFVVAKGGRLYMLTKAEGEVITGTAYRR